jgi:hypothetical protein
MWQECQLHVEQKKKKNLANQEISSVKGKLKMGELD